jgi:ribosome-interacting GTPase 1
LTIEFVFLESTSLCESIKSELFSFGTRVNQTCPDFKVIEKESVSRTTRQTKSMNVARLVCKDYLINYVEIISYEVLQWIILLFCWKAIECIYRSVLYIITEIDAIAVDELGRLDRMFNYVLNINRIYC